MRATTMTESCTQSGHPTLAGTRQYMMGSCKQCDAANWCWSSEYTVANAACAACEHSNWCHPEDIENETSACLECDEFMVCRSGKTNGGRCLFAEHETPCSQEAAPSAAPVSVQALSEPVLASS